MEYRGYIIIQRNDGTVDVRDGDGKFLANFPTDQEAYEAIDENLPVLTKTIYSASASSDETYIASDIQERLNDMLQYYGYATTAFVDNISKYYDSDICDAEVTLSGEQIPDDVLSDIIDDITLLYDDLDIQLRLLITEDYYDDYYL